jgi:hypothetical protein
LGYIGLISHVNILLLPILELFSLGDPSVPVSRSPRGFSFSQPLQDKHVSSPISPYSAGPPDRSKIVIFDLPDQPFNIRSKEAGSPMRPSLPRPPSPVVLLSPIFSLAPDRIVPFVHYSYLKQMP